MAKMLPKKVLDASLLKDLAKYYKIDTSSKSWDPEEFLEWECFSHPSLEYHDCNIRAKLLGGHSCKYCKHVPGRLCNVSCDFQHFCLAVYAWRLGIGGQDISEALNNNLYVLENEELYNEVIKKLSLDALEEVSECDVCACSAKTKEAAGASLVVDEDTDECEPQKAPEEPSEASDEVFTIKEAADYYGSSYCNLYNYVKQGRIPHELKKTGKRNKVLIKKSDLDEFIAKPRKRRSKKNV